MPQVQKLHTIFVLKKIYENIQEQIYVNENMKKEYSMYRSQHPHQIWNNYTNALVVIPKIALYGTLDKNQNIDSVWNQIYNLFDCYAIKRDGNNS